MIGTVSEPVLLSRVNADMRAWCRAEGLDASRGLPASDDPAEGLDPSLVALFREMFGEDELSVPPIVVVDDNNGRLILADGWHRYCARLMPAEGRDQRTIRAFVYQAPEGQAPIDYAYQLSLITIHGPRPLTQARKRANIERLLRQRPGMKDRAVARLVGVSHTTVGAVRSQMANLAGSANRAGNGRGESRPTHQGSPPGRATVLFCNAFYRAVRGLACDEEASPGDAGREFARWVADAYEDPEEVLADLREFTDAAVSSLREPA